MERESNQSSPTDRTRYLNIVYFVESARSHTIRINLRYARWGIGLAAVLCTWAFGSVLWILSLQHQVAETRERLETSLTTIFDYQIKNDRVFELAYPADATNSYYSESAHLASNNPVVDATQNKIDHKQTTEKTANNHPDATAASTAAKSADKSMDKSTDKTAQIPSDRTSLPTKEVKSTPVVTAATNQPSAKSPETPREFIDIKSAKISKVGTKIALEFDINNLQQEKAEGYIWAVATFTSQEGVPTYVAAPTTAKIDKANGQIKSFKSTYRFSIQRYKKKDFEFKTPAGKDWKLSKLTIHFTDIENTREDQINIPVDQLAFMSDADHPVTEITL